MQPISNEVNELIQAGREILERQEAQDELVRSSLQLHDQEQLETAEKGALELLPASLRPYTKFNGFDEIRIEVAGLAPITRKIYCEVKWARDEKTNQTLSYVENVVFGRGKYQIMHYSAFEGMVNELASEDDPATLEEALAMAAARGNNQEQAEQEVRQQREAALTQTEEKPAPKKIHCPLLAINPELTNACWKEECAWWHTDAQACAMWLLGANC
jgi:hypothetical protein